MAYSYTNTMLQDIGTRLKVSADNVDKCIINILNYIKN